MVPGGNVVSFSPIPFKWAEKKIRFSCLSSVFVLSSGPSNLPDILLQALHITDTSRLRYFLN